MPEKVQFIGYAINTGPIKVGSKKQYLGLADEVEDYTARVALLKTVFDKAAASSKVDADATKVLVIPEFFFRGQNGAYKLSTVNGHGDPKKKGSRGLVGELQELVKDKKWDKWVFVFGSVIAYNAATKSKSVQVSDIIMPFYKPTDTTKLNVDKPVDNNNFTVEEFFRLIVLTTELKVALAKDNQTKLLGNLDSLAKLTATNLIRKEAIGNVEVKRVADAVNTECTRDVFTKVIDSKSQQKYAKKYPFDWTFSEDKSKALDAYNISLIIEGGFEQIDQGFKNTHIAMKKYKSPIDFIKKKDVDNSVAGLYKGNVADVIADLKGGNDDEVSHIDPWHLLKYTENADNIISKVDVDTASENYKALNNAKDYGETTSTKRSWVFFTKQVTGFNDAAENLDPLGFFKVKNLTFAIDLCLDHAKGVSKAIINGLNDNEMKVVIDKVLPKASQTLVQGATAGVDIHLVPSCGLSISASGNVAKTNGYIFNCDGLNYKYEKHTNIKPGDTFRLDIKGGLLDTGGYKSMANTSTTLGMAHTGLMKVTNLDMGLTNKSTFAPVNTQTDMHQEPMAITEISLSGSPIKAVVSGGSPLSTITVDTLFNQGSTTKSLGNLPTYSHLNVLGTINDVKKAGCPGGALHIYKTVTI
ncbi:hypothetical protein A7985_13515 [Pseudoalteromonas luteoviolacea]|uniref:Uncharacterized protein n=1 Tax=Pseudoalteromonas luteoviolacea TaxID=43657 RepID=A0A1C0TPG4_9GAMM|nr:hypothetical protein [Pseudoalteromonas luteoviolacea]OCQ20813.1 hypothetical protein A7985_13515 [Pseudoalteromonas luteoviolacea]